LKRILILLVIAGQYAWAQCDTRLCQALAQVVLTNPRDWQNHSNYEKPEPVLHEAFGSVPGRPTGICESSYRNQNLNFECVTYFADAGAAADIWSESRRDLQMLLPDWSFRSDEPLAFVGGPEHGCSPDHMSSGSMLFSEDCRVSVRVMKKEGNTLPFLLYFHFIIPSYPVVPTPHAEIATPPPQAVIAKPTPRAVNYAEPWVEFLNDSSREADLYIDGTFECGAEPGKECDANTNKGRHNVRVKIEDQPDIVNSVLVGSRVGLMGSGGDFGHCTLTGDLHLNCTDESVR
jgi:hypothetical protein